MSLRKLHLAKLEQRVFDDSVARAAASQANVKANGGGGAERGLSPAKALRYRQLKAEACALKKSGRRAEVSQNGWLLSRHGRSLPANAGGFETHRDSITGRLEPGESQPSR
eukprot:COSAG06_NODE_21175_length_767_cov_0.764970_1_plen_110_part_01